MPSPHKSRLGGLAVAAVAGLFSSRASAAALVMVHRLPAQTASEAVRAAVALAQQGWGR